MTAVHAAGDSRVAYVKGAPQKTLARATRLLNADGSKRLLMDGDRDAFLNANEKMAGSALRLLGIAEAFA